VDVVLVLDASTSMLAETGAGRSKLDAARAAARAFLGELRLADGDQAAIIAFNVDAMALHPLSGDRSSLEAALDRIQVQEYTRIDRGIEEATRELASTRHRPGNLPAMIVLTDGRSNPVSPEVAEQRATEAKAAGITLFAIGLGPDVDRATMRRMATTPAHYYETPDAEALTAIYRRIAMRLPCPASTWWGGRP